MNLDEELKRELRADIDNLSIDDEGIFERMNGIFNTGMRHWIILIYLLAIAGATLVFWSGYQFFTRMDWEQPLFWGFVFLLSFNLQGFIKQWLFMEMNRNAMMREIKRIEVQLIKLSDQQQS